MYQPYYFIFTLHYQSNCSRPIYKHKVNIGQMEVYQYDALTHVMAHGPMDKIIIGDESAHHLLICVSPAKIDAQSMLGHTVVQRPKWR